MSQKHFPEEQIDVNKKRPLDLESRVGGNVQQKLPQTENDTPQKSVPQMKRRKIMSPNSSEGSVVEVTNFEVRGTASASDIGTSLILASATKSAKNETVIILHSAPQATQVS